MAELTWFLAQLRPNGAPRAALNLRRQGFTTFLPQFIEPAVVRNRPVERLKPLFPGYLFVQADRLEPRWTTINSTFGVSRLVSLDRRSPTAVPPEIIQALIDACSEDGVLRPPRPLAPGDTVELRTGAFFGRFGTVETLSDSERVSILLDCMGRAVRVSLPLRDVARVVETG